MNRSEEVGSAEATPCFQLGVLFVHGIGGQAQGRTLIQFGEPLFRWLFRWMGDGSDPGGDYASRAVRLTSTELHGEGSEPAHCTVSLEEPSPPGVAPVHQRWLLAESWWAEVFTPPPFTKLAFWLLTYIPWLALDFMVRLVRRPLRKPNTATITGLLGIPLLLLLGPIVGVVLTATILALLVVYLVPLAVTKAVAHRAAVALTKTIGDSFILMWSPMNHDQIAERIKRDLAWVTDQCERVAIVSHSQGAALSHEVLADASPPRVKLFLSLGSAVRRLAEIRQLRLTGRRWQRAGWLSLIAGAWLSVGVGAGIVLLLGGRLGRWPWWLRGWPLGIGLVVAFALLGVAYSLVWKAFTKDRSDLLLENRGTGLRWVDCFATADPVPNGPLLPGPIPSVRPDGTPLAPYAPIRTFNRRWLLNDHVTYARNVDQFVTRMARELAQTADIGLKIGVRDDQWFNDAEQLRRVRTSWLNTFRTLFIGAALFMTWGVAHTGARSPRLNLFDIAETVRSGTPSWVWSLLTAIVTPLQGPLKGLGILQDELVGALLLALAVVSAYFLIGAGWSFWDRRDTDRLFFRSVRLGTLGATLFAVSGSAAIIACILIGLRYA